MNMDDSFTVQFIFNSLLAEYRPFQINYNTIKDKWNVSELASILVLEETRLKKQGSCSINLISQGVEKKLKTKANKFKKGKAPAKVSQAEKNKQKASKCYFCGKVGHFRRIA